MRAVQQSWRRNGVLLAQSVISLAIFDNILEAFKGHSTKRSVEVFAKITGDQNAFTMHSLLHAQFTVMEEENSRINPRRGN